MAHVDYHASQGKTRKIVRVDNKTLKEVWE